VRLQLVTKVVVWLATWNHSQCHSCYLLEDMEIKSKRGRERPACRLDKLKSKTKICNNTNNKYKNIVYVILLTLVLNYIQIYILWIFITTNTSLFNCSTCDTKTAIDNTKRKITLRHAHTHTHTRIDTHVQLRDRETARERCVHERDWE